MNVPISAVWKRSSPDFADGNDRNAWRGCARQGRRRLGGDVVLLERRVDPIVLAGDAERGDRLIQPQIEHDGGQAAGHRLDIGPRLGGAPADLAGGRQQPAIGVACADVGDDDRRAKLDFHRLAVAAIERLDADGASAFGENGGDLMAHLDGAAGRLNAGFERARDSPGAALRKPAAVEVAADHEGVHREGAFAGGRP